MTQKRNQRTASAANRGFTLLELLISITLLVVIVVITMGALRISSRSVAAGERKMEGQERYRTALSVIDAQIQSQVPLIHEEAGSRKYYFKGDGKTLRFSTNHSIWGGQKGYVIVTYRIEAADTGKDILHASEQIPGIEGRWSTWLIEADRISFEYFHRDPAEEQGKWTDTVPEGTMIPERIRLHVKDGAKDLSPVFPVRVFREMELRTG
jgi:general secretion pathway protein J